jgi:flagellar basal-body rod protein FlgG
LTARETSRAGTKVGLSDPAVPSGRAVAQRIKATPGITGLSPPRVHIDAEGNLVNSDGYYVIGPDSIDPGARDISVGTDGTITYKAPGDDEVIEAGRLELSRFINPNGLELLGKSLYQATELSGEPEDWDPEDDNSVSLHGSYLEMSNVQIVEEMVNLITAQRAYEFNSKSIQSADEMLGMAANLKR